ncbi:hypothetical protein OG524_03620 [Streptomyces sp. NBC_01520]|uniref:DUF7848 domain-containing protein n=1 Tax=Streptomyces sp. NBC_01520 TaxID=2903892 RepID=UPI00386EC108
MPVRAIVRHIHWTVAPDSDTAAEPVTYAMQCVVCSAESERFEDWEKPQEWVLTHCGQNPSHHTYRESITRPWRTWMNVDPRCRS